MTISQTIQVCFDFSAGGYNPEFGAPGSANDYALYGGGAGGWYYWPVGICPATFKGYVMLGWVIVHTGEVRLYFNGKKVYTGSFAHPADATVLAKQHVGMGARNATGGNPFGGIMCAGYVWRGRELRDADMAALANNPFQMFYSSDISTGDSLFFGSSAPPLGHPTWGHFNIITV